MNNPQLRFRRYFLLMFFLACVCAIGIPFFQRLIEMKKGEQASRTRKYEDSEIRLDRPPAPKQGFVGSAVCAECHAEIAEKYARHPMGRSMAAVDKAEPIEVYENATFRPATGGREYQVTKDDSGVTHHERLVDADGQVLYDQSLPVAYTVGSGQHGRSYLIERDGILHQSPIAWFTQGKRWDLSPGYHVESHQRFERRVGNGCLYCHAGQVAMVDAQGDRYQRPAFTEASIGCERCHGPGKEHVAKQRESRATGVDTTIVNPSRLDADRREAVCNQCHLTGAMTLPRYGRTFLDFRPGDRLDDTLLMFVHDEGIDADQKTRPVSQVEQMRSSRCFVASEGKLGCISCHDPHEHKSPEEREKSVRASCLKCHEKQGCSLPEPQRQAAPANDSCTYCHMPALSVKDVAHTSLTDHRILRRPDEAPPRAEPSSPAALTLFDQAESRLPPREVNRAKGLALADIAARTNDQSLAIQAEELLVPPNLTEATLEEIMLALEDDPRVLESLGSVYKMTERGESAVLVWQRALKISPRSESLAAKLAALYLERTDWDSARKNWMKAIEINPYVASYHGRLALTLSSIDLLDDASVAANDALKLDPTYVEMHDLLAKISRRQKREDDAKQEEEISRKIRRLLQNSE